MAKNKSFLEFLKKNIKLNTTNKCIKNSIWIIKKINKK